MRRSEQGAIGTMLSRVGDRLMQARLGRNLTQAELAREAGVSKRTIERLEAGESIQLSMLIRVLSALGLLSRFESLVPAPQVGPMQKLEAQVPRRRRASGTRKATKPPATDWVWGDGK